MTTQVLPPTLRLGRIDLHDIQVTQFLGHKLGDSGFDAKFSFAPDLPVGTLDGPTGLGNIGTPFATLRPGLGVQHISHGWSFVNDRIAEHDFRQPITGYRSGTVLRDEATRTSAGSRSAGSGRSPTTRRPGYCDFAIGSKRSIIVGVGGFIGYRADARMRSATLTLA